MAELVALEPGDSSDDDGAPPPPSDDGGADELAAAPPPAPAAASVAAVAAVPAPAPSKTPAPAAAAPVARRAVSNAVSGGGGGGGAAPRHGNDHDDEQHRRVVGIKLRACVHSVRDVDNEFVTDLEVLCAWRDPSLRRAGAADVVLPIDAAALPWRPNVIPLNANSFENEVAQFYVNRARGAAFMLLNHIVVFREPLELRRFPFDRQVLNVWVGSGNCRFTAFDSDDALDGATPDDFTRDPAAPGASYVLSQLANFRVCSAVPLRRFPGASFSQAVCEVLVERLPNYYVWNVVVVLFVLVLTSAFSTILPLSDIAGRQSVAATFALAGLAYKWVISQMLPPVNYNTLLDAYVLLALGGLAAHMVQTLAVQLLATTFGIITPTLAATIDLAYCGGFVALWLLLHLLLLVLGCCGAMRKSWSATRRDDNAGDNNWVMA